MKSVYTLNETGAFIWDQIDGKRNIGEIISALTKEYNIDTQTASFDLLIFIDNMRKYLIIH